MCGIAGWMGPPHRIALEKMVGSLRHRGPDEAGYFIDEEASLGIARLAIVDVQNGHQPVFGQDRRIVAVFNGEIYNHRELARRLNQMGVQLPSSSDAEVIPHLYEKFGIDFVQDLNGMFAIAIWDGRFDKLILIRDHIGKKPLLYTRQAARLFFASEARAFMAAGLQLAPNFQSLDHVFKHGYAPTNSSAFQNVHAVPPGHILEISQTTTKIQRYWRWFPRQATTKSTDRLLELELRLEEAVVSRMVSERPLGLLLSGGVDSTVVAALMARNAHEPIRTFSVSFKGTSMDEAKHAERIARYLGSSHVEVAMTPHPADLLQDIAGIFDQPFADSSALPSLLVSRVASSEVTVALSGDGGDEMFGGYPWYHRAPRIQGVQKWIKGLSSVRVPLEAISLKLGDSRLWKLRQALEHTPSLEDRYIKIMSLVNDKERSRLWSSDVLRELDLCETSSDIREAWGFYDDLEVVDRMRSVDINTYLPGDILTKVDTVSMANALEVRSPFLDNQVVDFASGLKSHEMLRGRQGKHLLRTLLENLVPRELIDRPKQGFGIPRAAWLRGPLRDISFDLLTDQTCRNRHWFDVRGVNCILEQHRKGIDRDGVIWPMLVIELWARRWVDGGSTKL